MNKQQEEAARIATLGATVIRLTDGEGLSAPEISQRIGRIDGKHLSRAAVLGIRKRQRDMYLEDARDLQLCRAIDRGLSRRADLATEFGVSLEHVEDLAREVGAYE